MHLAARRLPNDQQSGRAVRLDHRTRPKRKFVRAKLAGADFSQQVVQHGPTGFRCQDARQSLEPRKRLIDVRDDVVDIFNTHRNAHEILGHTCQFQFIGIELAMRGCGWMAGQ